MIFIETPLFTRQVQSLLDDDDYAAFQWQLASHPDQGDLIEGTGGIRKIRVQAKGHGKRGGARVIYYHFTAQNQVGLLLVYPKNEKDDLTAEERKIIKRIVENWR